MHACAFSLALRRAPIESPSVASLFHRCTYIYIHTLRERETENDREYTLVGVPPSIVAAASSPWKHAALRLLARVHSVQARARPILCVCMFMVDTEARLSLLPPLFFSRVMKRSRFICKRALVKSLLNFVYIFAFTESITISLVTFFEPIFFFFYLCTSIIR